MKTTTASALVGGLTLAIATAMSPEWATAQLANSVPNDVRAELRTFLATNDVTRSESDALMAKLDRGVPWESLEQGSRPVSVTRSREGVVDVTTERYVDGSIAVSRVEHPTSEAESRAWGCTYTSAGTYGGYWKNCDVTVNLGFLSQGFHLDYENVQGTGARITKYGNYHHHAIGTALSNHRLTRVSTTKVRYSADLSVAFQGFPVGWTSWMQANQSGPTISTSHN